MEHGQQTGESIGAMLSSIASALREVSEKLDVVAARIDGAPAVVGEPSVEGRLAELEAWAFRAGQDISNLDTRVERLESADEHTPEDRRAAPKRPAAPLSRAAEERVNARQSERGGAESAANSAARSSFTPPREPALEPDSTSEQSFSAPREPASNFTAPPSREPTFTAPTPREPLSPFTPPTPRDPSTGQQERTTAAREPATTSASYSPGENAAYESIVASATTNHSGPEKGATADTPGAGLTGAHRAGEEHRTPVENTHVDKLQAMLDELKRTAAAPLGRSDVFDSTVNGYQSERTDAQRRPTDYRLSSPPPVS
jgi:hypothetical protein